MKVCTTCNSEKDLEAFVKSKGMKDGRLNVRGLLCNNCNRGIGHLQDSVEILWRAFSYLQENQ